MAGAFPAASSISRWSSSTTPSEQIARGAGPFYYLPKMESHLEARLWNDIFVMAQEHIGLPQRHDQGDGAGGDGSGDLRDGGNSLRTA
jgi:hypothetical protein